MTRRLTSIVLFWAICQLASYSQLNKGRAASRHYYEEIPFEYIHDKMIITASINGIQGRYIFDTGAPCIVFNDESQKRIYQPTNTLPVVDINGNHQIKHIVKLETIQLGNLLLKSIPAVYSEPFPGPFSCFEVDGIIGSNAVRFGAFKIDWDRQLLILADSYKDFGLSKKEGEKMLVNQSQSSPYLMVKINHRLSETLLIDTGSDDFYAMSKSHLDYFQSNGYLQDAVLYKSTGNSSHGMAGADISDNGSSIVTIDLLQINETAFQDVVVRTTNSSSRIGTELLKKGDVVLDYRRKRFFYNLKSQEYTWKEKHFGVDMVLVNDTFRVGGIWEGTTADSAGLQNGDIIVDLDQMGLSTQPICTSFFELNRYASSKKEITLYYRKKSEDTVRQVVLRRIEFD